MKIDLVEGSTDWALLNKILNRLVGETIEVADWTYPDSLFMEAGRVARTRTTKWGTRDYREWRINTDVCMWGLAWSRGAPLYNDTPGEPIDLSALLGPVGYVSVSPIRLTLGLARGDFGLFPTPFEDRYAYSIGMPDHLYVRVYGLPNCRWSVRRSDVPEHD